MTSPFITIITSTYNRAHTLPILKESILAQSFQDFEWIVVDDGSTDETPALLEAWAKDARLNLVILRQENGGKHRALNKAIAAARGTWSFIVDSDDRLPHNALEKIHHYAHYINDHINEKHKLAGLIGLKAHFDGRIVSKAFPQNLDYADALSLTYRFGIRGDKAEVFLTEILREFPFPEIDGERFLTEAIVWYRIARAGYVFRLVNEVLYEADYRADGLSAQSLQLRIDNPQGTNLFYKEKLEGGLPFFGMLREAINYVRFSMHQKAHHLQRQSILSLSWPAKFYALCMYVPGYIFWLYDRHVLLHSSKGKAQTKDHELSSHTSSIRVLHVINSLAAGGAERLLSEMLPLLEHEGIHSEVLILDGSRAVFADTLSKCGIEVHVARPDEKRNHKANPYNPMRFFSVIRTIHTRAPDIVHAHLAPSVYWCAIAQGFEKKPSYVLTEHASENRRMSMPFLRPIEKWLYGKYNLVCCVSESAHAALASWIGPAITKLAIVPNGIDLKQFRECSSVAEDVSAWLDGRIGVLMIARFVPVKDHMTALHTIAALPDRYALVLTGDGPELNRMQSYAQKLGITHRVLFTGSRVDIPQVLRSCSVYLQTSEKEGFGIAVLEAMASGLPVVASNVPGLSVIVNDAGILFPEKDYRAAAESIQHLEQGTLRNDLIAKGFERVQQYSLSNTVTSYASWYRKLAKHAPGQKTV